MAGNRFSLIFQDEEGTAPETAIELAKTMPKAPKQAVSKLAALQATGKSAPVSSTADTMDASAAGGSLSALSQYLKKKEEEKKAAVAAAAAVTATRPASSLVPSAVTETLLSSKPGSQSRPSTHARKTASGPVSYDRHSRSGPSNGRRHKGDDNLAQLLSTADETSEAVPSAASESTEASPTSSSQPALAEPQPCVEEAKPVPLMTLDQYLAERAKNAITLQPAIRAPEKLTNASGWIPLRPTETKEEAYYESICRNGGSLTAPKTKSRTSNSAASVPKLTVDPRLNIDYSTGPKPKPKSATRLPFSKTSNGQAPRPPRSSFQPAKRATQTTATVA